MQKTCYQCNSDFEITLEDLAFYSKVSPVFNSKKYSIPAPNLCPVCRVQRRISFRNFRNLYHRKCDLTGKTMISMYGPQTPTNYSRPFKVYDLDVWWSDKWDPLQYGRNFDFSKSFFDQIKELMNDVPKFEIYNINAENCRYSNMVGNSRNCYLVFGCVDNEDCYYGHVVWESKNCVDCLYLLQSELCYECVDCIKCYNLKFSHDCENCIDSSYLIDCRSCQNCFGCVGLRNKQYYIFNQPQSKEAYFNFINSFDFCDFEATNKVKIQLDKLQAEHTFLYMHGSNNENCSGDYIYKCKNVKYSFDVKTSEDLKFAYTIKNFKDCQDVNFSPWHSELNYNSITVGGSRIIFSHLIANSSDILYSDCCANSKYLFGCVGLKNKQYCILNKQYSKEEYEKLAGKIIEHMQKTASLSADRRAGEHRHGFSGPNDAELINQEWGEFFPSQLSPFGYNQTIAQEYYPLSKEDILRRGWNWYDDIEKEKQYIGQKFQIPKNIKDVTDKITEEVLLCEITGRPYKIIPQELAFYRKMNLPIPHKCFEQRHLERMLIKNPRKLCNRQCDCVESSHGHKNRCEKTFETTYAPKLPGTRTGTATTTMTSARLYGKVYCEQCYLKNR